MRLCWRQMWREERGSRRHISGFHKVLRTFAAQTFKYIEAHVNFDLHLDVLFFDSLPPTTPPFLVHQTLGTPCTWRDSWRPFLRKHHYTTLSRCPILYSVPLCVSDKQKTNRTFPLDFLFFFSPSELT